MKTSLTPALLLLGSLAVAGCSGAPTSPATRTGATAQGVPAHGLTNLQLRYTSEAMVVTATVNPLRPSHFSSELGGGWCFQLFLDTDEEPTGYAGGLDYLVRGIEMTPAGNIHVRRTEGGTGPGGWGESVGMVNLARPRGQLSFTVPLAMLNDDGCARFVLELYETIEKEHGGVWHEFVAGYEGTSTSMIRSCGPIKLRTAALTSGAARLR